MNVTSPLFIFTECTVICIKDIFSTDKSNIYSNLNEGKAIAINIKAGLIVQISSIKVVANL
jgi:hypothetical protein